MEDKKRNIEEIVKKIPQLTSGQLFWLSKVIDTFDCDHSFKVLDDSILDRCAVDNFGDALRIHHCFSAEPFSKDKFEYVLVEILKMSGTKASLAPRGNPGHDISIDGVKISLKTQADKNIKEDKLWISKFMELGRGEWGDNSDDLVMLRDKFFSHLKSYDRIFTLRALQKGPSWSYELVEIPKKILLLAKTGKLEMMHNSKQTPKPGYCHVTNKSGEKIFKLYFDGGGERKLQIKNLLKKYCTVHATWKFEMID